MKKWILTICLLYSVFCILYLPGCESDEVTPEQMAKYGDNINSLTEQIKIYQQLINDYSLLLQQSGAIDANDVAFVDKLISEADRITPEMQKIAQALKDGKYSDNKGLITMLEGLRAANQTTSGFNKYWAAFDAALLISISLLTWLAKKKSTEAKDNAAAANLATTTLGAVAKAIEKANDTAKSEIKPLVASNLLTAKIANEGKALITKVKAA